MAHPMLSLKISSMLGISLRSPKSWPRGLNFLAILNIGRSKVETPEILILGTVLQVEDLATRLFRRGVGLVPASSLHVTEGGSHRGNPQLELNLPPFPSMDEFLWWQIHVKFHHFLPPFDILCFFVKSVCWKNTSFTVERKCLFRHTIAYHYHWTAVHLSLVHVLTWETDTATAANLKGRVKWTSPSNQGHCSCRLTGWRGGEWAEPKVLRLLTKSATDFFNV